MAISSFDKKLQDLDITISDDDKEPKLTEERKSGLSSLKQKLDNLDVNIGSVSNIENTQSKTASEKPGLFRRTLDVLSLSNYAAAGAVKEAARIQEGDVTASDLFLPAVFVRGAKKGIKEKTEFADVLRPAQKPIAQSLRQMDVADPEKKAKYIIGGMGFGMDVVLDPMTYTPIGPAVKLARGAMVARMPRTAAALTGVSNILKNTQVYQRVGKTFVPGFNLPPEFHKSFQSRKMLMGAEKEKTIKEVADQFRDVNAQDIDDIVEILDKGIDVASESRKLSGKSIQLAGEIKTSLDSIYDDLVSRGLAKEESRQQFYFPRQFEKYLKKDPSAWTAFKPIKRTTPGFLKKRTGVEGWVRNAPEVIARYRVQAQNTMMLDDFIAETVKKFGKKLDQTDNVVKYADEATGEETFKIGDELYKKVAKNVGGDNLVLKAPIADEFNKFMRGGEDSMFWQKFDRLHKVWKGLATAGFIVPNPGYTTRNIMGNFWNNYLGGVINPLSYGKAAKQQFNQTDTFKKLKDLGWMDNTQAYKETEAVLKQHMTSTAAWRKMLDYSFDLPRKLNNFFENNAKLAHVIDQLDKGKNIDQAIDSANKYLFDYSDLTDWEKRWGRRIIPFYTFMRKNLPVQVSSFLNQPGKFTVPIKAKRDIENLSGPDLIPDEERPDWMQDKYFIQVPFTTKDDKGKDVPLFFNPYLPFQDVTELINNPLDEAVGRITPILKTAVEIPMNQTFFMKKEITSEELATEEKLLDYTKYLWDTFEPRGLRSFDSLTDDEKDGFVELMKFMGFYLYPLPQEKADNIRKFKTATEGRAKKQFEKRKEEFKTTIPGSLIDKVLD